MTNATDNQKWRRVAKAVLLRLLLYPLGLYILVGLFIFVFQRKFEYHPPEDKFGDCELAEMLGAEIVDTPAPPEINAKARVRYYLKKERAPKGLFVVYHGNAGPACDRLSFGTLFEGMGFDAAYVEYPGFGNDDPMNQGEILKNAVAAYDDVMARVAREKSQLPVYLFGQSLGTGVATYVATQRNVNGLVLVTAYPSILKVAQLQYWFLPIQYFMLDQYPAESWAQQVKAPALFFHGTNDRLIPLALAVEESKHWGGKAELVVLEGDSHNNWIHRHPKLMRDAIRKFVLGTAAD